jgi:hypothetical protein
LVIYGLLVSPSVINIHMDLQTDKVTKSFLPALFHR